MYIKSALLIVVLILVVSVVGLATITYVMYVPHVHSKDKLLNYKDTGIVLLDRHETPYYYLNDGTTDTYVTLDQISDPLEDAVVSTEDDNFFKHQGISVQGIARSVYLNLKTKSISYGGSTITQQLVKNTLLTSERSFSRKFQEALLSLYIERVYSKDEILEMYLNSVYYGEGAIGVADAASVFFDKEPDEITFEEAALLAGLLKSPSRLSISSEDTSSAEKIKDEVLSKMKNDGMITDSEYNEATGTSLTFSDSDSEWGKNKAPHYALMVEEELKEMYGEDVIYDGITVTTAMDLTWQETAQTHVSEELSARFPNSTVNGAAVIMNPHTGEVMAAVGSRDWFNDEYGKFNMAVSPRQPGSTFKPIVYSLAMDRGTITPATVLTDKKRKFANAYEPENYDKRYRGRVTVRKALANSLNVPSVEVMEQVGVQTVLYKADDFGITSLRTAADYGPSLVLGTGEVSLLEMVNAYSTFANNGKRPDPVTILEVKDKYGEVIYEHEATIHSVIDSETAYLMNSILSDTQARSEVFGNLLTVPFPAGVKTGTTENYRDAWTIGYTPDLVVGVWVGHNDNSSLGRASGAVAAAPIWRAIIQEFHDESSEKTFAMPDGIITEEFCMPGSSESARTEFFREGTQPKRGCSPSPIQTAQNVEPTLPDVNELDTETPAIGGEVADEDENEERDEDDEKKDEEKEVAIDN